MGAGRRDPWPVAALLLLLAGAGFAGTAQAGSARNPGKAAAAAKAVKATPIPSYQIEALTTAGMGAMAMGGAAVLRMMLGGAPAPGTTSNRTLELRLESPRVVPDPRAEHRIPAGLAMGEALPLQSISFDKGEPPTLPQEPPSEGKLRMLLFRGCAETAGADQPEITTLTGLTAAQRQQAMAGLKALAALPGAVDASGTSGRWPPTTESPPVPPQGSLVGGHAVVSTYAPEIRFQVSASHDFLAPVALNSEAAASGAQRLSWQVVPTALGYQATASGAGKQEGDIVIWTSSEAPRDDSWVPGDLRAPEAARLVQRKVLLPPERTSCAISAQAMAAMQGGTVVTFTAYGDTLLLASPKGEPAWRLSLERRSTATRLVGAALGSPGRGAENGEPGQEQPKRRRGFNPFSLF